MSKNAMSTRELLGTAGTPAPRAFSKAGSQRVMINVLCPEQAMTRFSLGSFPRHEAEAVRVVRCPVCRGTHVLVSTTAWVAGVTAADGREVRG